MNTADRFKNYLIATTPSGYQNSDQFAPIVNGACAAFDHELLGTYEAPMMYFFFFRDGSAIRLKGVVTIPEKQTGAVQMRTFEYERKGEGQAGPLCSIPSEMLE